MKKERSNATHNWRIPEAHSVIAKLLADLLRLMETMFLKQFVQGQTVLLVVIKDANTLTAKSLFQSEPEITITLAQKNDWEDGYSVMFGG